MWNITQDLELKAVWEDNSVLNFSIATNKKVKVWDNWEDKWEFHNLVAWGSRAKAISDFLEKGNKILIEWELQTRSWEWDDWVKKYKTEVYVNNFEFVWGWKKKDDDFTKSDKKHWAAQKKSIKQEYINVEDIPF